MDTEQYRQIKLWALLLFAWEYPNRAAEQRGLWRLLCCTRRADWEVTAKVGQFYLQAPNGNALSIPVFIKEHT